MTFEELQDDIRSQIKTIPDSVDLIHAVTGLCEESGEVAGLLKRQSFKRLEIPRERWVDELGDVLWYLTATAIVLDISLDEVFDYNKRKLEDRYGPL